jgi:hypothetical protein
MLIKQSCLAICLMPALGFGQQTGGQGVPGAGTGGGSGAVSQVSNTDSTLTFSPNTGNVVGSLNLGHTNTWTAPINSSDAGTASTPAMMFSGVPFTGGTSSTTYPLLYLNQGTGPTTLSISGTEFGINAPSAFSGNLIDAHVNGGASVFSVASNGAVNSSGNVIAQGNVQASGAVQATTGGVVQTYKNTPATATTCFVGGALQTTGTYWTGSASASNTIGFTPSCVAGSNGAETLTVGNSGFTGPFTLVDTGYFTESAAGAASAPGLNITGAPYTGGTATTNFPQVYLNQGAAITTFSTAGTEFGINAPSGFVGHLLNLFVNGGSTRFRVD